MSIPTVGDMMAAYAEDAVEHASDMFGVTLDYSPESVRDVETILGKLYDSIPRTLLGRLFKRRPPTDEDIWSVCKMYGGYIGEVVRRHHGGEWIMGREHGGRMSPRTSTRSGTCRFGNAARVSSRQTTRP